MFVEVLSRCSAALQKGVVLPKHRPRSHRFHFLYQEIIKIIQPVLLGKIIWFFESYDSASAAGADEAYMYAAGISLSTFVLTVLHHLYFYHVQRVGMKIRVALCHMIYRKVSADGSVPPIVAFLPRVGFLCSPSLFLQRLFV